MQPDRVPSRNDSPPVAWQLSPPNPDPTTAALALCGRQCLQASNGHGRRWAVQRCTNALVGAGASPAVAADCARAMSAIAQHIARHKLPPTEAKALP